MEAFWSSFVGLITSPTIILVMLSSITVGIIIGALPGLTATMSIAILVGLTYSLPRELCFTVIMGVYVGAIYGGSITAILLNIPGTGSAAATALDGYPLGVQGRASFAIGMTRTASICGTLFGLIMLLAIAPLLAKIALLFTSVECPFRGSRLGICRGRGSKNQGMDCGLPGDARFLHRNRSAPRVFQVHL